MDNIAIPTFYLGCLRPSLLGQHAVEHHCGHIFCALHKLVDVCVEECRRRILRSFDVTTAIIVVADIDNNVILQRSLGR